MTLAWLLFLVEVLRAYRYWSTELDHGRRAYYYYHGILHFVQGYNAAVQNWPDDGLDLLSMK